MNLMVVRKRLQYHVFQKYRCSRRLNRADVITRASYATGCHDNLITRTLQDCSVVLGRNKSSTKTKKHCPRKSASLRRPDIEMPTTRGKAKSMGSSRASNLSTPPPAQRDANRELHGGASVNLFVRIGNSDEKVKVGKAQLRGMDVAGGSGPGTGLCRSLHRHPLSSYQKEGQDLVVIWKANISSHGDERYPYVFGGPEEPPATLKEMVSAGLYAWDTAMMSSREEVGEGGESVPPQSAINVKAAQPSTSASTATTPMKPKKPLATPKTLSKQKNPPATKQKKPLATPRVPGTRRRLVSTASGTPSSILTSRAPVKRIESGEAASGPADIEPFPRGSSGTRGRGRGKGDVTPRPASRGVRKPQETEREEVSAPLIIPEAQEEAKEVVSVEDSDDDVIEVPRQSKKDLTPEERVLYDEGDVVGSEAVDRTLGVLNINHDDYEQHDCVIDVHMIRFPKNMVRSKNEKHLRETSNKLRKFGWLPSLGSIAVALAEDVPLSEAIDANGRLVVPVVLVDGYHRITVLLELEKEGGKWARIVSGLNVTLWKRKDTQRMTFNEVLWLGKTLNDLSSNVLVMSFADRIHTTVSFIRNGVEQDGYDIQKLTPSQITGVLWSSDTEGNEGRIRHFNRHSALALKFARNPGLLEFFDGVWQETPQIGVTHVSSDMLLRMSADRFRFTIQCLQAHVRVRSAATVRMGPFEDFRKYFFHCASKVYDLCIELGRTMKKKKGVEEVMSIPMKIGDSDQTVSKYIVSRLGKWYTKGKHSSLESRVENKVREIRRTLYRALKEDGPQDSEPVLDQSVEPKLLGLYESTTLKSATLEPRRSKRIADGRVGNSKKRKAEVLDSDSAKAFEPSLKKPKRPQRKGPNRNPTKTGGVNRPSIAREVVEVLRSMGRWELKRWLNDEDIIALSSSEDEAKDDFEFDEENEEGQQTAGRFEDSNPEKLPEGLSRPADVATGSDMSWLDLVYSLPSEWLGNENGVKHPHPWMQRIHLRKNHRAECLSVEDFRMVHHAVYWRASRNMHREMGTTRHPVLGVKMPKSGNPTDEDEALWMAAFEREDLARVYFAKKRMELSERGFCVLEEFGTDEGMATAAMKKGVKVDEDVVGELMEFFRSDFESQPDLADERNRMFWNLIINAGGERDALNLLKAVGRFITTKRGIVDRIEALKNAAVLVRKRALLDARIGQIAAALWLTERNSEGGAMYAPETGGRVLCTGEDCPRQVLHTDFRNLSEADRKKEANPGYFVMASGPDAFMIWVCERSHNLTMTRENVKRLSGSMVVRKVRIPPFSVFIGRGDVFHAGAGYDDAIVKGYCFRYHMYLVPDGYNLPDAVHRQVGFTPRFEEEEEDEEMEAGGGSSDDGDVDMDDVEGNNQSDDEEEDYVWKPVEMNTDGDYEQDDEEGEMVPKGLQGLIGEDDESD